MLSWEVDSHTEDTMLFGNIHIEIPDTKTGKRTDVEALCAALEAIHRGQEHYEVTIIQSVLVRAAAPATCAYVEEMGFDPDQLGFCYECEAYFIAEKLPELRSLLRKNIHHVGYDSSEIGITLDDMRLTAALVFLEEFTDDLEEYLEEQVALAYDLPD